MRIEGLVFAGIATADPAALAAFFREAQVLQTELAEGAKGFLGIIEPPPEFGAGPATGGPETTARGSTPEMPRTTLGDEPPDMEGIG